MSQTQAPSPSDSAPSSETPADLTRPTTPNSSDDVAPTSQDTIVPAQDDPLPTQESPPTFATASEAGVEEQEVPTTLSTFRLHKFNPLSNSHPSLVIGQYTVQMIRHKRGILPGESQAVFNILRSIAIIAPLLTVQDDKDLNVRRCLRNILGETNAKMGALGSYEYPEPLRRNAAILLEQLDLQFATEAATETVPDKPPEQLACPTKQRRMSISATRAGPLLTFENPNVRQLLRGIVVRESPRVYALDRTAGDGPRDCRVFGHNGLSVGQWWPLRICALRDGAHGSAQGGIAGSGEEGAWSIVVSGTYDDLDRDHRETIHYSGSNSHTNTDPLNPIISSNTKAMRVSKAHNRPIRVIRSSRSGSKYAPSSGLRYDGLYKITSEETPLNDKGGAYVRFKLLREPDQPAVDMRRPNEAEKKVCQILKGGL